VTRRSWIAFATTLALGAFTPALSFAAGSSPVAWVSKQAGNDAAGCGAVTNPCKTFQYAHDSVVAVGGTIMVRDAGGYGPLAIKNAISIINESGVPAGIFGATGDAIVIDAAGADVFIKGLILSNGVGNGITISTAKNVSILGCTIRGFAVDGIATFGGDTILSSLLISDTMITANLYGLNLDSRVAVSLKIANATVSSNTQNGLNLNSLNVSASVSDSVISDNGGIGVSAQPATAVINRSTIYHNNTGVTSSIGGSISLMNSVVLKNGTDDLIASSGSITTFSNNLYGTSLTVGSGSIIPGTLR
jgi:hypothetical protein